MAENPFLRPMSDLLAITPSGKKASSAVALQLLRQHLTFTCTVHNNQGCLLTVARMPKAEQSTMESSAVVPWQSSLESRWA